MWVVPSLTGDIREARGSRCQSRSQKKFEKKLEIEAPPQFSFYRNKTIPRRGAAPSGACRSSLHCGRGGVVFSMSVVRGGVWRGGADDRKGAQGRSPPRLVSGGSAPRRLARTWRGAAASLVAVGFRGRRSASGSDYSCAIETQTISRSLRAKTHLPANAGCDQMTRRPGGGALVLVGSRMWARLISS